MPVNTTWWLGRAAALYGVVTLLLLARMSFGEQHAPGRLTLQRYADELGRRLRFLRASVQPRQVIAAQVALGASCVAAALCSGQWLVGAPLPVIALGPPLYCGMLVAKRTARIEELIEPWLNAIANSLKASPSLRDGIASSHPLVPWPMNDEIDLLLKESELGTPLDQALDSMVNRIRSRTLGGAVLALKVARRSGGNLPEMLESAAASLREMARLEGVVRTKTAEGKAQAFVIGLIPLPMIAGILWMDPEFLDPLVETFAGHLVVGAAAILWILAISAAHKIVNVDI